MLYRRSETLRDLEWVIFDEVHYMNDAHVKKFNSILLSVSYLNLYYLKFQRGVVWEEVLILLPDHINIVMLSATIPNHMEFAEWVGKIKQRHIYVISTKKRPVPLEHNLYTGNSSKTSNELFLLIDPAGCYLSKGYTQAVEAKKNRAKQSAGTYGAKGTKQTVNPAQVDTIRNFSNKSFIISVLFKEKNIWLSLINVLEKKELLPAVAFTFSRKRCDDNINLLSSLDLNSQSEKSEIHIFVQKSLLNLNKEDRDIPQVKQKSTENKSFQNKTKILL
jgi:antiviral helicase SKI2